VGGVIEIASRRGDTMIVSTKTLMDTIAAVGTSVTRRFPAWP
jgi:hypothetical protein